MALFRQSATLRTMARPAQVAEALTREVKPGTLLELDLARQDPRQFRGEVRANSFRIVRRVQFRNSFAPVLEGHVAEIDGGSLVTMNLFVPTGLLLFVTVWTVLTAGAAIMVLQQKLLEQDLEAKMIFAMALIPLVGLCVAWLGFSLEAGNSQRVIAAMLPPYVAPAPLKA